MSNTERVHADYAVMKKRIGAAFRALRKKGFICRSAYKCCMTCASSAIGDVKVGAAYWHKQDEGHFRECGVLCIRYYGDGAPDGNVWVGREVSRALQETGLSVEWNGDPGTVLTIRKGRS